MATTTILDLRRNDQRRATPAGPFWITSGEVNSDADDLAAVLFSFPKAGSRYIVHQCLAEVTEAFAGGTVACTVGIGTLATDDVTTDGVVTVVDVDEFLNATDLGTMASTGTLFATASDVGAAILGNTGAGYQVIDGAATTVPAVYAKLTSSATITAGKMRVKMLVSELSDI
jgi:hypothetical protein